MYNEKNATAHRLAKSSRPFFSWSDNYVRSDNQPFKAAAYQDLLRKYNVSWHSSSAHYPQSNGRAEAEVKQIKKLVCGSKFGGRWDADKMAHATNALPERITLRRRPISSREFIRPAHP